MLPKMTSNCPQILASLLLLTSLISAQRLLPKYNVDRSKVSTSGISSGACMATQLHVAYSSRVMGAGLLAGAPYYCAQGSLVTGSNACSSRPNQIDISDLVKQTNRYAQFNDIDPTTNMREDRVFIYAGNQDSVVDPGVALKVAEYYSNYVITSNIRVVNINAEHTFPTLNYGNACNVVGTPYLGRCNYDGAYELLDYIYGGLTRPGSSVPLTGEFYEFDQSEFFYISPPSISSMDRIGFVYVPSACVSGQNVCRLHIVFHGCHQGRHSVEDEFARNAGYNEVGELNNIIILYPQAVAIASNPLGCWDWWGYTVNSYATKGANQPLAIFRMMEKIS